MSDCVINQYLFRQTMASLDRRPNTTTTLTTTASAMSRTRMTLELFNSLGLRFFYFSSFLFKTDLYFILTDNDQRRSSIHTTIGRCQTRTEGAQTIPRVQHRSVFVSFLSSPKLTFLYFTSTDDDHPLP
jgi:hypothetical protein